MDLTDEMKARIDRLSHYDLLKKIRFAKIDDLEMRGTTGEYWLQTYRRKRDENLLQAIEDSNKLGWVKPVGW